jgi:glutamate-1-semialdehyde 2,1-aminomutase
MSILCIVQARMGSKRLPGKVLKEINGKTLIEILLKRLNKSNKIDNIVVATSVHSNNLELIKHINEIGFNVETGNEDNVLDRYVSVAKKYSPETIVRITGDCPLVDSELVDECIDLYTSNKVDYVSNAINPTYPDGLDVEVFSYSALLEANNKATSKCDLEHVTPYIRESGRFSILEKKNDENYSQLRLTVDEDSDLKLIKKIINIFKPDIYFSWEDIVSLYGKNNQIFEINSNIKRNSGMELNKGQKLWKRAKSIIPGGNMLLSKNSEMFLPDYWPSYFEKAKGCEIWDLDGNVFQDYSIMGIGTNILGYSRDEVDKAVLNIVSKGNMSTLNCPEEVYLAEKLIEMHPWAHMVRFARSGGEANSIAIRIARAASGRDKVAVCGYHGWHDWYLAANIENEDNLDGHLLPGLKAKGVPESLAGTVLPFEYNNFSELTDIINNNDVGVIKMEVMRNDKPENNFLHKIRNLCNRNNIILIFDECTSGFREEFGGLHKKFNVEPDMAMFGKALGNGYAITSVIGKKEIMEYAQETFISSTFWTERIGPAAALKSLEVMKELKSWDVVTKLGLKIRDIWKEIAKDCGIKLEINGIPALSSFTINSKNFLLYKTLITQEMLDIGILASNSIYLCTEHKIQAMDKYFEKLNDIFKIIAEAESGRNIEHLVKGPICHGGFKRLN